MQAQHVATWLLLEGVIQICHDRRTFVTHTLDDMRQLFLASHFSLKIQLKWAHIFILVTSMSSRGKWNTKAIENFEVPKSKLFKVSWLKLLFIEVLWKPFHLFTYTKLNNYTSLIWCFAAFIWQKLFVCIIFVHCSQVKLKVVPSLFKFGIFNTKPYFLFFSYRARILRTL